MQATSSVHQISMKLFFNAQVLILERAGMVRGLTEIVRLQTRRLRENSRSLRSLFPLLYYPLSGSLCIYIYLFLFGNLLWHSISQCVLDALTAIQLDSFFVSTLHQMANGLPPKVSHPHHYSLVLDYQTTFRRISRVTSGKPVMHTSPMADSPRSTREYIKINIDDSTQ